MGPTIKIQGLWKSYSNLLGTKKVTALRGLDLEVQPGEVLGVVGPNGCGKTTLIGLILGLLRPDAGSILVDGLPPKDLRVRARVGYVPERLTFDPWMNGSDFVAFHHELSGKPKHTRRAEVQEMLHAVGLKQQTWKQRIKNYSRGMLQRVALAQALIGKPELLLLDEPSSGMDPEGVLLFRALLKERCAGATVVINSHQLEQVERVCSRVVFIKDGKVQAEHGQGQARCGSRVLRVRLLSAWNPSSVKLEAALKRSHARIVEKRPGLLRLEAESDEACASALAALAKLGGKLVEASPESTSVEELFKNNQGGAR